VRMRSVSLCCYDIWHSCRQPPWLLLWESQVPRVMHYTERCIEVRPCYLFDKLEFDLISMVNMLPLSAICSN